MIRIIISIDKTVPIASSYREYVNWISPYFKQLGYLMEEVIMPKEIYIETFYPI
ncbi:MAG: hypothetical protein ACFFAN_16990 [Promethearchaeota archaeon]